MTDSAKKKFKLLPKDPSYLDGPKPRFTELLFAFDVFKEFIKGFRAFHFAGPYITVFGSARFQEDHPYYKLTYEISKKISNLGFTILTGGGPGIMEAANKAAYENGGMSVGLNIILPQEQQPNPYMHKWILLKYFFVRKTLLIKYSYGFIVMPGGMGTMDEFFETLTLIQTKTIKNFPVVLIGKEYYKDIDDLLNKMLEAKAISESDLKLILITDNIDEAVQHIKNIINENFIAKPAKARKILFEN